MFLVSDPEVVDHILRINFWAYEKGEYFKSVLYPLVGEGIFGSDGQHWRWQRKLASRIFTVQGFREFTDTVFCAEADRVRTYLAKHAAPASSSIDKNGKVIDLSELFYKFTLDSFGEIAFGESFGCLKDPEQEVEFAMAFDRLNASLSRRFINPFWKIIQWWSGQAAQVEKDAKLVHDFAYGVIRRRRREQGFQKKHKDLMQLFMEAQDEDGQALSDDMLRDMLLNFLLAGRDTTAQALSWMFYLIHRSESRKEILEKLQEETDRVLQGPHGCNPTYETTKQQKYAEACLNETLRLYPPVPQNLKVCVQDDILPGGVKIYKNDKIAWSTWAMGRDTKIWGPDATEFKPERWLTGEKPSSSKFVSFHLGPRTCLGQQFATIEAITMLSMLLQKFTFELVNPDVEPRYIPALTLPLENGLPVRCKHRT
ncbi:Protein kinase alk2 [Podila humilis]|nr:Protein kinase alk2 [Podila humilis]